MTLPITAHETVATLTQAAARLNTATLGQKIRQLRQSRSTDAIQQLQSEAIVELYEAVRHIQEAIWPMLLLIPGIGGVRDAAQGQSSATTSPVYSPRSSAISAASKPSFKKRP